jgi:hypothetical protein
MPFRQTRFLNTPSQNRTPGAASIQNSPSVFNHLKTAGGLRIMTLV